MRLSWRVAGRTAKSASDDNDLRPAGDGHLIVHVDPADAADTGTLRCWFDHDGTETTIVPEVHVDITRVLEQGWTHIEIIGEGSCRLSLSLCEGVLRYVRTDLPDLAGLPGGTYEAPTLVQHSEDEGEQPEDQAQA